MMMRLLFWIALGILVVFAIRSKLRGSLPRQSGPGAPRDVQGEGEGEGGQGERMVSCAHCHLYFPASEAVRADGLDYCSPAHVRLPAR
ncbi:PP0621 family protein [Massilia sp. CF038]|uniref:PP0621 family protein n=1 Tax=Massilia sp. CF038 TaxID=1881045 RepID=UPI0009170AE7|nr:PP0621 family protein [Massilia sp. CF038]SHG35949.1 uncharacterized protein SAMN05428948_0070 [Massilia sp. CF038]